MPRWFASWAVVGLLLLVSLSGGCTAPTPTRTVQPTPGLVIRGHVWLNIQGGSGLAGVEIYRSYASYPGVLLATTDQEGYYESDFAYIPGDEMVAVWAELEGYAFEPEQYRWRHYYGHESRTLNFVAVPVWSAR